MLLSSKIAPKCSLKYFLVWRYKLAIRLKQNYTRLSLSTPLKWRKLVDDVTALNHEKYLSKASVLWTFRALRAALTCYDFTWSAQELSSIVSWALMLLNSLIKHKKNILIVAEVQHVMPTKLLCKVIQDIFAKNRCYCMAIKFSYIYLTLLYSAVLVVFCTTWRSQTAYPQGPWSLTARQLTCHKTACEL